MNATTKFFVLFIAIICTLQSTASEKIKSFPKHNSVFTAVNFPATHIDSIHQINFRYKDHPRGIRPYILPAALIGAGTALHFSDWKYDINDWRWNHFNYTGDVDDYLRFAPTVGMVAFNLVGIKGKNNPGNQAALLFKSALLNSAIVYTLKSWTNVIRPTGEDYSMPSGHTSLAFATAHVFHREYGEKSIWYSIGAYASATAVGVMRVSKGGHWASDVLVGAGIGVLSTELVYLTHQYKWDWAHIKKLDIFPFSVGRQKGVSLVYTF